MFPATSRFVMVLLLAWAVMVGGMAPLQAQTPESETSATLASGAIATEPAASRKAPPVDPAETEWIEAFNELLDQNLGQVNSLLAKFLFFDVSFGAFHSKDAEGKAITPSVPLLICFLIIGAVYFTFYFGFINFRAMKHSIDVIRGRYDHAEDDGDVSHFQALTSALSATVGLGNIAGVAIAIQMGGPGAVFWMTVAGLFGMSMKFVECTLGQMYRRHNPDGTISGGPMYYLEQGLRDVSGVLAPLGKVLAVMAAFIMMGASLGGGNMFQANQSYKSMQFVVNDMAGREVSFAPLYGVVLMIFVGLVVLGGIKRIGAATARIVPLMAAIYAVAAFTILFMNFGEVPNAIWVVLSNAFNPTSAAWGGVVGVMILGMRRAAFSNEAGLGSASIAHSAAKTKEPVREGIVALMEPFIDTVVICNLTAMVIILTGVYTNTAEGDGILLTKQAFHSQIAWFPIILAISVVLFAYSTMISWCYYGERAWIFLLDHVREGYGQRSLIVFRLTFVAFIYVGAVAPLGSVLDFADLVFLSLAFPNVIGCMILAPKVKAALNDYWRRHKSGEMKPVR